MIKAQGDREQAMSEAEWKQLSNLIENDRRERVSGPHIYDAYIHMYTYIQTYTVASTVSLFTLASLLSMVKHGYNNIDCMHRFPPCARSLTKETSAMLSISMCCTSNCKHDT